MLFSFYRQLFVWLFWVPPLSTLPNPPEQETSTPPVPQSLGWPSPTHCKADDGILHPVSGSLRVPHLKSLSSSQTPPGLPSCHSAESKSSGFRSWKQSRDFPGSQANPELPRGMHGFQLAISVLSKDGFMWRERLFSSLSRGQLDLMRQLLLWRFLSQSSSTAGMT